MAPARKYGSITGRAIILPFKLPVSRRLLQWIANLLRLEIIEKVKLPGAPAPKISPTSYTHTIPRQQIDAWDAERHRKDDVEKLSHQPGFHDKPHGRSGSIYYVDALGRVTECYWEYSGVPQYHILIPVSSLSEWILPKKAKLSAAEKSEILAKMRDWLQQQGAKANFY